MLSPPILASEGALARSQPSPRPILSPGVEQASYFGSQPADPHGSGIDTTPPRSGGTKFDSSHGGDHNSAGFFGDASKLFHLPQASNAAHRETSDNPDPTRSWTIAASPLSALSPSSNAFSAKFNRLGGFAAAHDIPPTPLHAPAHSPFIPPATDKDERNPFDLANSAPNNSIPSASTSFQFSLPTPAARRLAPRPSIRSQNSASASSSTVASAGMAAASRYTAMLPTTLFSYSQTSFASTSAAGSLLVLDLRTHTAYLAQRLAYSINVCVPSTLLRRPGFGVDRVQDGLPEHEQDVFAAWPDCETIVAIDAESTSLSEASSGVVSLLAKFERAGFKGKLGWVKGGWYAIKTQAKGLSQAEHAKLFHSGSGSPRGSTTSSPSIASAAESSEPVFNLNQPPMSKKHGRPVLQVRDLPIAAFQQASTSAFVHSGLSAPPNNAGVTSPSSDGSSSSRRPNLGKRRKSSYDPREAPTESGSVYPKSEHALEDESNSSLAAEAYESGRSAQAVMKMSTNPFFDNIRQNSEALSLDRSLANLAPVQLPDVPDHLFASLPPFLQELLQLSPSSRADKLARQYYELEVAERERLEGTFRWHARHTSIDDTARPADGLKAGSESPETRMWKKFGISAGVELGALNRFKNIFPYEHRRVKLVDHSPNATDYINASHLYLPPSSKRFIASQGPLPTTYSDFWQLCEQEKVGVIIMLTNLNEGGRDKCGRYWITPEGGQKDWRVEVEGDEAHKDEEAQWRKEESSGGGMLFGGGASSSGFFAPADANIAMQRKQESDSRTATSTDQTVRRLLTVQRLGGRGFDSGQMDSPPRKIRHIQYRAWPDFDIPADPAELVSLIDEVDRAQAEYMAEICWKIEEHGGTEPPILAHCSAGVGRTGVYIMVSSLLDTLRKAMRNGQRNSDPAPMDVDVSPPLSTAPMSTRPSMVSRSSDPETSSLSAHFSLSSLDSTQGSPAPTSQQATSRENSTRSSTASPNGEKPSSDGVLAVPLSEDPTPPLLQADPIFAGVNCLREQRMSMVANYRQYVCVVECVLEGIKRGQRGLENIVGSE
ncbi:uncharacterized protein JCM15063_000218 [Sporobolomyces koalae]|uniref:uncharacterized protein n=1 Tax=Sporobolomyces koalae TaxID=500713 RepID=UPI00316EF85E